MRFHALTPDKLLPQAVDLAYVAGLEAIPWRSVNSLADGILTIDRTVCESGNLYIPWDVPGIGQRVLSTCTLMERNEPYCLVTELARGTLHRARSLVADMETQQLEVPSEARDLLHQGLDALFTAITDRSVAEASSQQAISLASRAIELLSKAAVAGQLEELTTGDQSLSSVLVGTLVDDVLESDLLAQPFLAAFHSASVPFRWNQSQQAAGDFDWSTVDDQVRWCKSNGLQVIGGPLIQLDPLSLPESAYGLANNYDQFEAAAIHYARLVVKRFEEQVDIWVCAGRLNVPGAIAFSEEQKLRLAVATLEAVRSAAPRTPVVISFDQPWAEYLAAEDFDLSPLHFADALVRADLGVAGVGLEMNLSYWPGGTQPRDLLAVSRHIDRWSLLGIPLLVYLTLPSQVGVAPQTIGAARVVPHSADRPEQPAVGQDAAADLVRLLLTKPALHGIIWNQWSDVQAHEFPFAGLINADGRPKPLLTDLAGIRKALLK
jgi:hypothetical protein